MAEFLKIVEKPTSTSTEIEIDPESLNVSRQSKKFGITQKYQHSNFRIFLSKINLRFLGIIILKCCLNVY